MSITPADHTQELQQKIASALGMPPNSDSQLDTDSRRRYGLTIGGQRFLLALRERIHVVNVPRAYRLPNTRSWCLGIANLRGSLIPLYDLASCFELPDAPADRRMMLVLGDGDDAAGTIIDGPPRHVLVSENQESTQVPILHATAMAHADTAYRLNDGIWVELDWRALFRALASHCVVGPPSAAS